MILILSYSGDLSTDWVMDWIRYYQYPVFRLNSTDVFEREFTIDLQKKQLYLDREPLPLEQIKAAWFRRFGLKKDFGLYRTHRPDLKECAQLGAEHESFFQTLCYLLRDKAWLTDPRKASLDKCNVLLDAERLGFDIPKTHIINSKNQLTELHSQGKIICKSVYEPFFPQKEEGIYSMYTTTIDRPLLKMDIPDVFSASLVQERIEKEYEVRSFFLCGKIYSMAIFSQEDDQTKEDFRNYQWEKPNRNVPYQLPNELEQKIRKLMRLTGLNCGSLDFIKSTDGKYYFLEINPVGQFGMVDLPCNYGLHQKVAQTLIKMDSK